MPEIWLGYGSTYVVVDIKQENLLRLYPELNLLSDEQIKEILNSIEISKKTLVLPLSSSRYVLKVISILIEAFRSDTSIEIEIATFSDYFINVKNYFGNDITIFQIRSKDFFDQINKFNNVIFVSKIGYDPFFGFSGTPSILTRNLFNDLMNEIYHSSDIISPNPGQIGDPLKRAFEFYDKLGIHSIEILANQYGISNLYYATDSKSFGSAFTDFRTKTSFKIDEQKALIVSAGPEPEDHKTLTNSLFSLWNSIGILKKGGTGVLLAENRNGIGNGALTKYLEKRLNFTDVKKTDYINGLEHLIYLENMQSRYNLGLVSSIPLYYTKSKLGFSTFKNVKEVLETIFTRYSKSSKVMVCPDPNVVLFITQ